MKKLLTILGAVGLVATTPVVVVSCTEKLYSSKVTIVEEKYWSYYKTNNKLPDGVPWTIINYIEIDKDKLNYIEIKPWRSPNGEATLIRFIMIDGSIISQGSKGDSWEGYYNYYHNIVLKEAFPNKEIKIVENW